MIRVKSLFGNFREITHEDALEWAKCKLKAITTCKNDSERLEIINAGIEGVQFTLEDLRPRDIAADIKPLVAMINESIPELPKPRPLKTNGVTLVGDISRELNIAARERMKTRLLADILFDMNVCMLEGWDAIEYLKEIISMLSEHVPH